MNYPRFIISCVCLSFSLAVSADSQMNFVVSASRYVSTYPNSSTIGNDEIRRFKDFSVGDVLQSEPGIQANRYGGKGGVNALSLQGANSNQTLILMDGVPLKNTVYGSVDLNNINLDQIHRIELYRGGMSSVYGADAVGGVVNL
ncbi:MAG: TonB-dependent receptor plug domain-containing protein, partial [Candidatus Margulisiibacteriota bacterium]